MAAKKKATIERGAVAKKKATIERGAALVDRVIARVESGKDSEIEIMEPRPIGPDVLDALRFSNGKPLPPSLKRLLAYAIEISPSGRATCRTCRATIDKGALRFVESDLMGKRHHHVTCAAKKLSQRFLAALEGYPGDVPDLEKLVALGSTAEA